MDEYFFEQFVSQCKFYLEDTHYLEILNYTLNARQPETFSPYVVTLAHDEYREMIREFIFRKSDVRKKGRTRGWETMLSYNFQTGITTGYVKGTPNTDITTAISHLKACSGQAGHPSSCP
ncbi:unnamed protein product [Parascedosporium putredinis]|uniref:Uncharacterized protein n=1 Tax=Parascedosporium putredinis TaxID=1442378 RepID=A0A9P1ME11_9PEZI|nr:unnamed protein product [Parascedosporium putredinis]CAI8000748.1 unnamed protein product [Parascedosporium putredinis]